MFPHDHELLDEDSEIMSPEGKRMEKVLDEVLQSPFRNTPLINRIHGYIFVFDKTNKKSFYSMMCLIETVKELEKQSKTKSGFSPKILVIGNKSDLQDNK
jgi:hypothetical protein